MAAPTVYSTDADLVPIYVSDAAILRDSLEPLHLEAFAQINRDLIDAGRDTDNLAILTPASLIALVKPSCCYVMHLLYREKSNSERGTESLDKAKYWESKYQTAFAAARVETIDEADGDEPESHSGYVVLG